MLGSPAKEGGIADHRKSYWTGGLVKNGCKWAAGNAAPMAK
jgi:hypothetical protein